MTTKRNIAGMSLKGGRNDNFYFCLLEYYTDQDRYFLKSLLQVKDEAETVPVSGDDAIRAWIDKYELMEIVVDFPLSQPECHSCKLDCPGLDQCPVKNVVTVKERISDLLEEDYQLSQTNPKEYERNRNSDDEIDFNKNILDKETSHHILSRSFKRRLKKGFLPYWNRPLDLWVWSHYYDQLLDCFNNSYDSFGNTSLMLISRFTYLKRHFPEKLELYEGNVNITLIELLRAKIILRRDIDRLFSMEEAVEARLDIIQKVEDKLDIFIYDTDLEILAKQPRAFESFLLSILGKSLHLNQTRELPAWTLPVNTKFVVPDFRI